jgi:hypothetical protein
VNIADPPQIVVVRSRDPRRIARTIAVPAAGPHGLDLDLQSRRLCCACDAKTLVTLDAESGRIEGQDALSGVPDVVFFNPRRKHLYAAVCDPGVIDVFDTATMERLWSISDGEGCAHAGVFAGGRSSACPGRYLSGARRMKPRKTEGAVLAVLVHFERRRRQ